MVRLALKIKHIALTYKLSCINPNILFMVTDSFHEALHFEAEEPRREADIYKKLQGTVNKYFTVGFCLS